ncbi:MAG: DUF2079 domain-containing protein [Thermoplasmataceae archaeon]
MTSGDLKLHTFVRRRNTVSVLMIIAFAFYNAVWIYISYIRYTSLNYSVYDLGLNYERLWQVFNGSLVNMQQFLNYFFTDFIVVILSPLYLTGRLYSLLAIQILAINVSALIVYRLAVIFLNERWKAVCIAVAFLYYPPIAGITWFDFHYQVFFMPFFLGGYLLYVKRHYMSSFILMIFSGTVYFPYSLFPLIFALTVIVYEYRGARTEKIFSKLIYGFSLLAASSMLLIIGYLEVQGVRYYNFVTSQFGGSTLSIHTPGNVLFTLFLIFALVVFVPFISKRWLPFFIPFFALIILSQNIYFIYPYLFHRQYSGLFTPFIFLGIIDGLIVLSRYESVHKNGKKLKAAARWSSKHIATAILAVILVSALFLQPYGPLNSVTSDNFNLGNEISQSNLTQLNGLHSIVSLLPENASNILIQNNLPEVFPRSLYNGLILDAPLTNFVNFSMYSIVHDAFNASGNGQIEAFPIEYVLLDYSSNQFVVGSPSMHNMSELMYGSGYYGVYAQSGSVVLLQRGYSGSPVIMVGVPFFK